MVGGKKTSNSRAQSRKANAQNNSSRTKKAKSPNTGSVFYLSRQTVASACKQDADNIRKHCDTEEGKKASKAASNQAKPTTKKPIGGGVTERLKKGVDGLDDVAKTVYGYKRTGNNAWVDDHCQGLWFKPAAARMDHFEDQINQLKTNLEKSISDILQKTGGVILDKAKDAAINYGEKAAIREGASLATLVMPGAGEVIVAGVTLWNIVDGIWTAASTAYEAVGKAAEAYKNINGIKDQLNTLQNILNKKISPTELWADIMTGVAYANPCLQARRCQLVPFKSTGAAAQAKSGKGCCPGQTGHHLLPEEMFQDCPAYTKEKHKNAPTVCVEGVNNSHGSHGAAHTVFDEMMRVHYRNHGDKITNEEAINKAVRLHNTIFKPACSPLCLKAQLDDYYKNLCKDKMKPRGGKGTDIEETSTDINDQSTL